MSKNPYENSEKCKDLDMPVYLVEIYEEIYSPMFASNQVEYLKYKIHQKGIN